MTDCRGLSDLAMTYKELSAPDAEPLSFAINKNCRASSVRTPVQQTGRPEPSGPTVQHERSIGQSSPKTISTRPWRPSSRSIDSNTLRISSSCNDMNIPTGIDTNRSSANHSNTFAISVPLKGLFFAANHLYQQFVNLMAGHCLFYPVDAQSMQPDKEHRRTAKHLLDCQVELHLRSLQLLRLATRLSIEPTHELRIMLQF